jgi:hypothetical protein
VWALQQTQRVRLGAREGQTDTQEEGKGVFGLVLVCLVVCWFGFGFGLDVLRN